MRKSKWSAIKREDGFASKFEAKVFRDLTAALLPGETLITQVPIKFACGAKLVLDFAVVVDGKIVRYVESKGMETSIWRLKLRMLKHEFPEIANMLTVVTQPKWKKKAK